MVKILTDTSSLITPNEGEKIGLNVVPLTVTIEGKTYHEFTEIETDEFLHIISQGNIPTSSQPPIGETVKVYESLKGNQILNITIADGLSGAYSSAESAKSMVENADDITVVNSGTLCGPQRFIVRKALKLAEEGFSVNEIVEKIKPNMDSAKSFLIPQDFDFLVRGGRLMPMAGKIGGALNLVPLMIQSEDGKRLAKYSLARNFAKALDSICKYFTEQGVNENYLISVSHANNLARADQAKVAFAKMFPKTDVEIIKLSPAFTTQGGPGCVAIQIIDKR